MNAEKYTFEFFMMPSKWKRLSSYPIAIVFDRCLPVVDDILWCGVRVDVVLVAGRVGVVLQPLALLTGEIREPVVVQRDDRPAIHIPAHVCDLEYTRRGMTELYNSVDPSLKELTFRKKTWKLCLKFRQVQIHIYLCKETYIK